jgi:DNA topoisomerase-1
MEKYIEKEFGKNYIGKLDLIKNKDKNNPHEAIRVTDIYVTNIPNKNEAAMYRLIWRNTVESCMSDAKYIITPLKISAPTINDNNKSKKLFYNHTIEMPVFLGWKQLTTKNMDQDSVNGLLLYLKTLQETPIIYSKIESTTVIRNKIQYYTESSLIKKLEDIGIGRPSTFAMIVDTIQERGYVTCNDIKGEKMLCTDFTLEYKKKVKKKETEKTLGNEKSKLQIQPTGELCIQFLTNYFNEMFSYDYTSNMEIELDEIANDKNKLWYELCEKCVKEITSLSKKITKIEKEKYPIDEHHEVVFTQYGPSIKKTINDVTTYLKVKDKNISIDKLKTNHYKLEDIIENEPECLGTYDNFPLKIKKGPYGNYLAFGDQKISLKEWKQDICDLTYNDAIKIIESTISAKNKSIVRNINDEISIRNGKYGHYIFYQTSSMKKPTFFPLKKCPLSYESCEKNELIEWINNSYLKGK